ncbi:MAG TPA: hypothetical protein VFJ43_02570 [Bacteroidia bacterium]|nr:hypothetical protein [Bacteroidia bacterium]
MARRSNNPKRNTLEVSNRFAKGEKDMSTTPTAVPNGAKEIRTRIKNVLNLDTKETEPVVKIGQFVPVTSMQEFVERLGNDSAMILQVVNDGMEEYAKQQLESASDVPFVAFDDEGNPTVSTAEKNFLIFANEDKEKSFAATVLNLAKMMFGYPDIARGTKQTAEQAKANRDLKNAAKAQATEFILSNPAAIEKLKTA